MRDDDIRYWPATDGAFQRWMNEQPHGCVLNVERASRPMYMVLHRSGCLHIASFESGPPGASTQRDYRKVCALSRCVLRAWVRDHGSPEGRFSQECGTCKPRTD